MNAEIISVGTELLLGDIVNTNAQFLSKELAILGINVYIQTVVGDNPKRLLDAYKNAFERCDLVITTGGLGPTADDLTKEIAAEYFGKKMLLDNESLELITNYFNKLGTKMTENNKKQAYIPEGAKILKNSKGTAPGCMIEENGKILVMLPGPPFEMKNMFNEHVMPYFKKTADHILVSKTLRLCGIGESAMEDAVKDLMENQSNPTIAPYAKTFEAVLRITASAENEEKAYALIKPVSDELYKRFGSHIYAEDETTLEQTVVGLIKQKGLTIAIAESCTGGGVTKRLVDVAGVSQILLEGAVTYSNNAKINRLGVRPETLEKYGAVSEQTAAEMAEGIAKTSGASIGISTTGVAGPDGGTDEKPVGLVYIGLSINGKTTVQKLNLTGDRQRIRARAIVYALDMIRKNLI